MFRLPFPFPQNGDLNVALGYFLTAFDNIGGPVVSSAYNHTGTIFAYAVSYDWSKGHSGMTPGYPNKVFLHACKDDEVKKRPKAK
jgi:mRNA export factor